MCSSVRDRAPFAKVNLNRISHGLIYIYYTLKAIITKQNKHPADYVILYSKEQCQLINISVPLIHFYQI